MPPREGKKKATPPAVLKGKKSAAKLQRSLRLAPLVLSLLLLSELPIVHAITALEGSPMGDGTVSSPNPVSVQVKNQLDALRLIDEAPLAGGLTNSHMIIVKDTFNFSEASGLGVRSSWSVIDSSSFDEQIEQVVDESPPLSPSSLQGDLISLVQNPLVQALGAISAVAVVAAILFALRRRKMQGCQEIAQASPPCRYNGEKHACRLRPGHRGVHRCRCKVSWMVEVGEEHSGYPRGSEINQISE